MLRPVLFVADMLQPVDGLAVERLLDGNMRHRRRGRCPVPMLFARRKPNDVARPDFLDGTAPMLRPTEPGRDNQCLTEGMGMPCGAGAGLERDARAANARGLSGLEERVDTNRSGEVFRRPLAGELKEVFEPKSERIKCFDLFAETSTRSSISQMPPPRLMERRRWPIALAHWEVAPSFLIIGFLP